MYELLGICLVLAALLTINALASLTAAACWRLIARPARSWSARTRGQVLFAMRMIAPGIAATAVVVLLIPSYLAYEPHSTTEVVSKKLAALALVSAAGLGFAVWRGVASWLATRALLTEWLNAAEPIQLAQLDIPTFRIPHQFPIIAVVGTLRPRLFIAERVLDSLSEEELIAAIAHEYGHLAARDNLKRVLMRACRDLLSIVPCGRSIDRAWADNAEAAADEYAASGGSVVALNLASALIEIARMVPSGARPTMPAGAFLLGDGTEGVLGRVNRLIDLAAAGETHCRPVSKFALRSGMTVLLPSLAIVVFLLTNSRALASLHAAMEHVVRLLT
jgi:Zn-dependent protease with chaperone function